MPLTPELKLHDTIITEGFGYTLVISWGSQIYMQKCLDVKCINRGDDLGYFGEPGYTVPLNPSSDHLPAQLIKLNADGLGVGLAYFGRNDDTDHIALFYKDITGNKIVSHPQTSQETSKEEPPLQGIYASPTQTLPLRPLRPAGGSINNVSLILVVVPLKQNHLLQLPVNQLPLLEIPLKMIKVLLLFFSWHFFQYCPWQFVDLVRIICLLTRSSLTTGLVFHSLDHWFQFTTKNEVLSRSLGLSGLSGQNECFAF